MTNQNPSPEEIDQILAELKANKKTILECIIHLRKNYGYSLIECQDIFYNSSVWSEAEKETFTQNHEAAEMEFFEAMGGRRSRKKKRAIIPQETTTELLAAMDLHSKMALQLIEKLISETDQPEKASISQGDYAEIQNAPLLNGGQHLTGNWQFDVHGEHCRFQNTTTGQTLEVSLGDPQSTSHLDPCFFYRFIETTPELKHLTQHFHHPFADMFEYFETLEKEKKMIRVHNNRFKKA